MPITPHQIKTFILAGMLADAVGVPYEFRERNTFTARDMIGHGTYDMPIGAWSDDSSLTLILMQTLNEGGSYADYMDKLMEYAQYGRFTPTGVTFDIGNTTRKAMMNYAKGASALNSGDPSEFANGNGAIMRLSPLAVALRHDDDAANRVQTIINWTRLTHRHPRSLVASVIYVELLRALLLGKSWTEALTAARAVVNNSGLPSEEIARFSPIFEPDFSETPRERVPSSGYVVDSLLAAIWLNEHATDYRSLVLEAINLGSDTDTIAQLAAHLYAAQHPDLKLPEDWLSQLIVPEEIDAIISEFAEKMAD